MSSIEPEANESQESIAPVQMEQAASDPVVTHAETTETPVEAPPVPSPEASLPPEAQGEPNGGPLGCCLGTIMGTFLAFALVTVLSIVLVTRGGAFITVPAVLLGAVVGGYAGWRIGKRIYKEYEPPIVKQRAYPARTKRVTHAQYTTHKRPKRRV